MKHQIITDERIESLAKEITSTDGKIWFTVGANTVRAEVAPVMMEFAVWLQYQNYSYQADLKLWKPWEQGYVFRNDPGKTASDLLDLFLEERNAKNLQL